MTRYLNAGCQMIRSVFRLLGYITLAPGWLNGTHPTISEETVDRRVCFNFNGDFCKIHTDIQIKNCGSYFLYYLKDVTIDWPYNYRYCSE